MAVEVLQPWTEARKEACDVVLLSVLCLTASHIRQQGRVLPILCQPVVLQHQAASVGHDPLLGSFEHTGGSSIGVIMVTTW